MAERFKALVLKTSDAERHPWVQIPLPLPKYNGEISMSEMEYHAGKVRKVDLQGKTVNEFIKGLIKKEKYEFVEDEVEDDDDDYDQCRECLWENDYEGPYKFTRNSVYELIEHIRMDESGSHITINEDGTATFLISFYNGGGGFEELLDEVLKDKL